MKIFLIFFLSLTLAYTEVFEINTFETMVSAGKKSLNNNQNNTWVFKKNNQILDINNSNLKKELTKYFYYMDSKKTPIRFFKTPSTSMCKTIVKGQSMLSIFNSDYIPKRNDLLVHYSPKHPSAFQRPTIKNGKLIYIKQSIKRSEFITRCVAVGNDEIFIKNKNLFLHPHEGNTFVKKYFSEHVIITINNKLFIKNPYMAKNKGIFHDINITETTTSSNLGRFDFNITKIPNKTFFVMGDNREHSNDSRHYGSVKEKDILGKVILLKFKSNSKSLFGIQSEIGSLCKPPEQKVHTYEFFDFDYKQKHSIH